MLRDDAIFLGLGDNPQYLELRLANRHGLVAGATGTGKTVTLRAMAEGFSAAGVPVFAADVKGDLSGLGWPGAAAGKEFLTERAKAVGLAEQYRFNGFPVSFWDIFGRKGHPVRTTISDMGPVLLARLLELNDTQEGVLNACFAMADDEGLLLLDLKDLRSMLTFAADNADRIRSTYGNISAASVGAVQRRLLVLEQQGAENLFGEPALDLTDLMQVRAGRGVISLLAADDLMQTPKLYATFLLWMLSELFEHLPEVGDVDKPRLVFFFDEAHLLFTDAPRALVEKVTQVVRLIRSKGVGVYFVTQNPADIPDSVLGQLGNRIQHALRAYTPKERKAIKAAADSFRANPAFKTETIITELAVGEALVSTLGAKGVPGIVERTLIRPPESSLDLPAQAERDKVVAGDAVGARYDRLVDRESAYEILSGRAAREEQAQKQRSAEEEELRARARQAKQTRPAPGMRIPSTRIPSTRARQDDSLLETAAKSILRTAGNELGRRLVRGLLGSLLR